MRYRIYGDDIEPLNTVAQAEALTYSAPAIVSVLETGRSYQYDPASTATRDGIRYLNTAGEGRLVMNAPVMTDAEVAAAIRISTASQSGLMTAAQATVVAAAVEGGYTGGLGSVSNLRIKNNSLNPNYQVDIDAAAVVVRNSSKLLQLFDIDLTVSITTAGTNGLDAGSESANAWYYIWVIYNQTTSTVAGLLSASSSAPAMPSGYTYKVLAGAVRNDASSNFVQFSQTNDEYWYNARRPRSSTVSSNSYTLISIDEFIPASSNLVKSALFGVTSTNTTASYLSTDGINAKTIMTTSSTNNGIGVWNELYSFDYASPIFIPVLSNGIYYKQASTGDTTLYARAFRWSHI